MHNFKRLKRRYVANRHKAKRHFKRFKNHPFVIPITAFLLLLLVSAVAWVFFNGQTLTPSDSHVVIVSYDHKKQTVPTRATTVGDLLQRLKITINKGDVVEPVESTPIVEDNFHINVYRARPVTIVDGTQKIFAFNAGTTPRAIAADAGVTVYPEDEISIGPADDTLNDGLAEKIVINPATPATLILYGTPVPIRTRTKTVAAVLKEKNVKVASTDTVTPSLTTPITPGLQIFVNRMGTQIATSEQDIPFTTQVIEDPTLSFGTTAIRQQGTDGKLIVTYQLQLQNGKEVGRTQIQSVVAQQPVPQIEARGKAVQIPSDISSVMAAAGISPGDYPYVNYIVSRESGWCPTKWQGEHTCPSYYEALYSPDAGVGYGLCQSTPGDKMASAGSDWETNPVTQLRWCSGYSSRYGGWEGSYEHWLAHSNW